MAKYEIVKLADVPEGVRFCVPHPGQIVEVAYGDFGDDEPGVGDPWMRITDTSETDGSEVGPPVYYRRIG